MTSFPAHAHEDESTLQLLRDRPGVEHSTRCAHLLIELVVHCAAQTCMCLLASESRRERLVGVDVANGSAR